MKIQIILLSLISCIFCDFSEGSDTCTAPEIFSFQKIKYNNYVCQGIEKEKSGEYLLAIEFLQKSEKELLFEEANVWVYPRLAKLHFLLNRKKVAFSYLLKSKLSLEIFYGLAKCDLDYEYYTGVNLEDVYARGEIGIVVDGTRQVSKEAETVFFRMCQENLLEQYKSNFDIDEFIKDPIVLIYQDAIHTSLTN
jgi:hypothetical protein